MSQPLPPEPPRFPKKTDPGRAAPSPAANWLAPLFVVMVLAGAVGSLFVLPLLGAVGVVFILGGIIFAGFFLFHYFVWGRWLSRILEEEDSVESDQAG